MNSMMVYECDAVGCASTGKPRVLMLPLMSNGKLEPQETTFPPSGWVEVRTFLGLDGEIWVGAEEVQLTPHDPLIVQLAPLEHFQFTHIEIHLNGGDEAARKKVRVSIKNGRTQWDERPALEPLPDCILKVIVVPWAPMRFYFSNPTDDRISCKVIGRGYPLTEASGAVVNHRIRYLCPDHAPKIRQ